MKNNFLDSGEQYKNVSLRPFKYLGTSVHTQSLGMLIVLLPQIVLLVLGHSFDSLLILCASVTASFCAEGVDFIFHHKPHYRGVTSAVNGIVIGLLLPSSYPPAAVFVITFASLLLVKYAYGGFSNSWVNPVAITVTIAWLIGMSKFPSFQVSFDQLHVRNPSLLLIQNGTFPVLPFDARITNFLNTYLFRLFGVSVPTGYVSLFWDTQSVIPAFRFNLITIISSILLVATNCIRPLIPACFIIVYSLLVAVAGPLFYSGVPGQGDILLALLSSGTLFSALFILQWYGTTPVTVWGKCVYGICAGIISFLITGCGTSPVGSVFTVLVINSLSPVIQRIEDYCSTRYLNRVLMPELDSLRNKQ